MYMTNCLNAVVDQFASHRRMKQAFLKCICIIYLVFEESISVLMLFTPVFIFTSGSSALLGCSRCSLLIWLSLHVPYSKHFSEFMSIFFRRKQTKHENTWMPFSYDIKMAADSCLFKRNSKPACLCIIYLFCFKFSCYVRKWNCLADSTITKE